MAVELVVLGASLGGLRALGCVLGGLDSGFRLPLACVLHRRSDTAGAMADVLQKAGPLPVMDATDKETIEPGRVYLAPADYHLLVERGRLALSIDAPVDHSRPSIDVLFESAAETYGNRLAAVLLTGNGRDGARGLAEVRRRGGLTAVQDPASAEAPEMPSAALRAAPGSLVLPLSGIAPWLASLCAPEREDTR